MTEDQAREVVIATTCQVLEWRITLCVGNADSGLTRFPIQLHSVGPIVMADDWVPDIRYIPASGYAIFGFFTWRSAASAIGNINNRDYDHLSHQNETDHVQASL